MQINDELKWNNVYSVGIESIDTQHKKLFEIVNRLFAIENTSDKTEEIKKILYEFSDYMRTHFDDEEKYMLSIGYPDIKEHILLHQNLVESLASVMNTPADIETIKTKMNVIAKEILVNHIVKEDTKILAHKLVKKYK
ncbi:hemerythrin family protein [Candidatus Sulfurimonas marisnigri]|uniref:Hemerythrin family protein n=1 Tax=Candidatus Sulfurimonas marisnigri TaxID=2740405 RepID=A0A7S7M1Y0_9BACT|nr:hemerythrin family protein [Candidatus Sulfurimonas marisnigri]QOY55538.1 hemerythrin family protein [Candidatus Sulfurimonas marisnigri]